jgi:hypothetical protein
VSSTPRTGLAADRTLVVLLVGTAAVLMALLLAVCSGLLTPRAEPAAPAPAATVVPEEGR